MKLRKPAEIGVDLMVIIANAKDKKQIYKRVDNGTLPQPDFRNGGKNGIMRWKTKTIEKFFEIDLAEVFDFSESA